MGKYEQPSKHSGTILIQEFKFNIFASTTNQQNKTCGSYVSTKEGNVKEVMFCTLSNSSCMDTVVTAKQQYFIDRGKKWW